ncbi:MAG: CDP-alcohol phosphatidyltransferase family protein [Candidatus Omnitrophica bacterium]|nr:CDP-alcohol phosphatidyltransferase family protein [Candidatus Omnitrophota bacterium]
MTKYSKKKINVYSDQEEAMMNASQAWRGKMFLPLLKFLTACKVRPNHLTYLSLAFGVAFCFLFCLEFKGAKSIAFGLLAIHVLLDGLDGPLARFTQTDSNKGSFTDSMVDQIVVALTTIALIYTGNIQVIPGGLYIFLYTMVVVFAMVRNSLEIPYSLLVRPRFFVYAWFLVDVYLLPGSINYVLWACIAILMNKMITGFYKIRKKL